MSQSVLFLVFYLWYSNSSTTTLFPSDTFQVAHIGNKKGTDRFQSYCVYYCRTNCTGFDTWTINPLLVHVEPLSSLRFLISVCFVLFFYFSSIISHIRSLSIKAQATILINYLETALPKKDRIILMCIKWPWKLPELFISIFKIVTSL